MNKTLIEYREVPASRGLYGLFVVLAAVIALGAWAFFKLENAGHYISGMNNQVVWGLPHVVAIFLIVAASGALNVASIATVFGKTVYQPWGRFAAWLAMGLLLGGLLLVVLDLGRPDRLLVAMTHFNFQSMFAWNIILYNGFLALAALYIWTQMDRLLRPWHQAAGWAVFVWRLLLTTGTGLIFGFLVARPAYEGAIMAPLLIACSLAWGLAVFLLALWASAYASGRELAQAPWSRLRNLLATFIGAVLLLELARYLSLYYAPESRGVAVFLLGKGNAYSGLFWLGQVLLGSVLPLVLLLAPPLRTQRWPLGLAALCVIVGGLAQLAVIIIGGQAYPLELFPRATVSSAFFDGAVGQYSPSLWEILLCVGGVVVAVFWTVVGVVVLRLLPTFK